MYKQLMGSSLLVAAGFVLLSSAMPLVAQGAKSASACEALAKVTLPDTTITAAKMVAPGEFKFPTHPPGSGGYPSNMDEAKIMPAFCMVAATIRPTIDSRIHIEVWLPPSGWNGKLLGAGNGGWGGRISHAAMITGILQGFAATSSDSGHDVVEDNGSGSYVKGHPEKVIDLGYRAEHEMTLKAKAIVAAYFGVPPKYSYFIGARLGGYQGLVEAWRYPNDYDGIVSEAPQISFASDSLLQLWPYWLVAQDKARAIPKEKYAFLHQAELSACDGSAGLSDGFIADPSACHFDPELLRCRGAEAPDCLTSPQVDFLKKVYQGPVNPRTGKVIAQGPFPGTESEQMLSSAAAEPRSSSLDLFKYIVFQNPNWDWKTFNWDSDVDETFKATTMLAADPALKSFADRNGKLLVYFGRQGAQDAAEVIEYYKNAASAMGRKAADSIGLFAIPGSFQEAPFDKLAVIEQWVEHGNAPGQIVASYPKRMHRPIHACSVRIQR